MNELLSKALRELNDIKNRLMTVEEILQTLVNTSVARASRLLSRVRQLLADGTEDPTSYKSDAAWAEIEDLVDDLRSVKDQLQDGLFRKVMAWLKDSRERLKQNNRDVYAINQIRGVEKALSNTAVR